MHIVLIGNKIDLKEERCVSYEDGLNLANEWKNAGTIVSFIEVSAATGEVRSNFEKKKKFKKKKLYYIILKKVTEIFLTMLNMIDSNEQLDVNNNALNNDNNNNNNQQIDKKPNPCIIS